MRPLEEWDQFDVYLFDIDGTLLHCQDAVHYFAFCSVLTALAGRPVDLSGVTTHGNTDIGILRDALRAAGVAEDIWRARRTEVLQNLCSYVHARKAEISAVALPGVHGLLTYLQGQKKLLGIVTGNLSEIGKLKLASCGLLSFFSFGAYSDAFESRAEVFAEGIKQSRNIAGHEASICIVGDTPADVQAAIANRVDVVAVATGVHPISELLAESPSWCVDTLEDLPTTRAVDREARLSASAVLKEDPV